MSALDTHRQFLGCRAQLQRFRDARLFRGRTKSIAQDVVEIEVLAGGDVFFGDEFSVDLFGEGIRALFEGVTADVNATLIKLEVSGGVRYLPSSESLRVQTAAMPVVLRWGNEKTVGEMIDMSPMGFAFAAHRSVPNGQRVTVELLFGNEPISIEAQVKNCRAMPAPTSGYRVGLQVFPVDEAMASRWRALLSEYQHAA